MGTRNSIYKLDKKIWEHYLNSNDKTEIDSSCDIEKLGGKLLQSDFATDFFLTLKAEGNLKRFCLEKASYECDISVYVLDKELFEIYLKKLKVRVAELIDKIGNNSLTAKYHKGIFEDPMNFYLKISDDPDTLLKSTDTWFDCLYESLYIYKTFDWENFVIVSVIS